MKNRTRKHFIQQTCIVTALLLCLQPAASAHGFINQAQSEVKELKPDQSVEREIAGGESHTYQITLQSGQFIRVVVGQKGIDLTVALADPEGKQIKELSIPLGTTVPESIFVASARSGD